MLGRQRRVRPSRRQRARAQGASSVEFLILIALLGLGLIAATRSIRDSLFATSGRVGAHVEALTAVDEGGPAPLNSVLDAVLRERDGTSAEDADSDDAADSQDADSDSEPSLLSSLFGRAKQYAQDRFDEAKAELEQSRGYAKWVRDRADSAKHWFDDLQDRSKQAGDERLKSVEGNPILEPLARVENLVNEQQLQANTGPVKSVINLAEGLGTAVADPVDTLRGLESLAEHSSLGLPNPLKMGHGALNVATGNASVGSELNRTLNPVASAADDASFGWNAITAPYKDAWDKGRYTEVGTHAGTDLALIFFGDEFVPGAGLGAGAEDVSRATETANAAAETSSKLAGESGQAAAESGSRAAEAGDAASAAGTATHVDALRFDELGPKLGEGGNKEVFAIGKDEAVGVLKPGKNPAAIADELRQLRELQDLGLPTVKAEPVTVDGKPALRFDRYEQGSKDVVRAVDGKIKTVGKSDYLNARSIDDLRAIQRTLVEKRVRIDDLQFLIGSDGKVVIADPLRVMVGPGPSKNNLNMIRQLIQAAGGR
jgi:hypothetical protein